MANTWTNFYPTLWSQKAYFQFASAAIAPQVVNMTWVDPEGAAEAIRIPKFSFGTTSGTHWDVISALVNAPDDVSESTLLLNLNESKGFFFQIPYEEQDTANVALGESVLMQRTAGLASVVDQRVFSIVTGAGTILSGATIGKAQIVSGIRILNSQNAPQTDRVLVVDPFVYSDLLNENEFVRADSVAGAVVNRTGIVGQILGLDVFLSNNLPGTGINAFVAHRAALAMAMLKTIEVRVFDQPRYFSVGYTGRARWGQVLIDSALMVGYDKTTA